ncbi:hypothetical protein [Stappia sp.]|uniref:hypothetical protein n=1 Tax=Stappia sp. TaxID=1870903 RepID=UPI003C7A10E8
MQKLNESPLTPSTADKIELLKRMMICHADLQTALSAITFLDECDRRKEYDRIELRRLKCYETAFVIAYGRAFTESKGSRHKKLSLKKIKIRLSEKEILIHKSIIDARNKKYAHSDLEKSHIRLDLHSIEIENFNYSYPHIQFDEGLEFIDEFLVCDIMNMTRKIMQSLSIYTRSLAIDLRDFLPAYIKPI